MHIMYILVFALIYSFVVVQGMEIGSIRSRPFTADLNNSEHVSSNVNEHFDWRDYNGVSPVKDQNKCACCWAFSAVANIESQYWRLGPQSRVILSEQYLLDCNKIGASCNKSTSVVHTIADIMLNGGIPLESHYRPYTQSQEQCLWNNGPLVNVAGVVRVQPGREDIMARALREHGPLSVAINDAMMVRPYREPWSIDQPTEEECPSNQSSLNHAVLIVGYGVYRDANGELPYWIIKNSWGTSWGDGGYYYIQRGINACGIASDVCYATV